MHVQSISANVLRVPLRKPFRHASAVRHYSDNVVVRVELADGTLGWGEGVPRPYVTGESPDGALAQFGLAPLAAALSTEADDWQAVIAMCQRIELPVDGDDPRDCRSNSLRCAIELALVDAYGKHFGEPASAMLSQYEPAKPLLEPRSQVAFSTTIDAEYGRKPGRSAFKMRVYGFRQCKVKVGSDNQSDARRLGLIRRWIGPKVDLRVDANEAWLPEQLLEYASQLTPYRISCIEQPLAHEQLAALGELRSSLEVPVMLDESLTSMVDAREAVRLSACDLFNIRLSKCGGLLRSVDLAAYAAEQQLGYQLGCHPGETGILSAAGRHFATTIGGARYLEGSYDRHVLAEQLTTDDMTFGYGGRAPTLTRPGLGTSLDLSRCEKHLQHDWVTRPIS
ncbi:dipeptide epimerase [Aeoliella mucimassa]|uniref:Dipeptide epimerase n=1 Tax=Aeoliella mucimassa TaxID=2527972 RepID=A0A518AST1_9BACT|nr:dipeptide epimerase [Aeoliella mucimassa]QDU57747.1 L-Ala-D/L-Glu epimerase [Aeoliella mucimassa]